MNTDSKTGFAHRALIASGILVGLIALAMVLIESAPVLLLTFAALLLAVPIAAGADRLATFGVNRYVALAAVIGAILLVIVGIGMLSATTVAEQSQALQEELPRAAHQLEERLRGSGWGNELWQRTEDAQPWSSSRFVKRATGVFSSTLGFIGSVVLVLFLAVLFAATPKYYTEPIVRLAPLEKRARLRSVFHMVATDLKMWLLGKLAAMILVGVLTTLGLQFLNIPFPVGLGFIAAILTFIPNIGPVLAALPAILLALLEGPASALYVVALYVAVQTLESYVVTPIIQQKTVSVPPGFTIGMQLIFGSVYGLLGLFVATPLAVAGRVLIRELYVRDVLGETEPDTDPDRDPGAADAKRRPAS